MSHWESASINISYNDFAQICRICLAHENLRDLQDVEYLIDLLRIITNAEVKEDDGLPQNICDNCIKKLEEISDFTDLTRFNDSCLRQVYVTRVSLKTNTVTWSSNISTNHNQEIHDDGTGNFINNNITNLDPKHTDESTDTLYRSIPQSEDIEPVVVKVEICEDLSAESETSSYNRDYEKESSNTHNHSYRYNKDISDEEYRKLRRREGNRRAAAKRREKVRDAIETLVKEMNELEASNVSLKTLIKELEEEKDTLLKTLSRFKCTTKHLRILEHTIKQSL